MSNKTVRLGDLNRSASLVYKDIETLHKGIAIANTYGWLTPHPAIESTIIIKEVYSDLEALQASLNVMRKEIAAVAGVSLKAMEPLSKSHSEMASRYRVDPRGLAGRIQSWLARVVRVLR